MYPPTIEYFRNVASRLLFSAVFNVVYYCGLIVEFATHTVFPALEKYMPRSLALLLIDSHSLSVPRYFLVCGRQEDDDSHMSLITYNDKGRHVNYKICDMECELVNVAMRNMSIAIRLLCDRQFDDLIDLQRVIMRINNVNKTKDHYFVQIFNQFKDANDVWLLQKLNKYRDCKWRKFRSPFIHVEARCNMVNDEGVKESRTFALNQEFDQLMVWCDEPYYKLMIDDRTIKWLFMVFKNKIITDYELTIISSPTAIDKTIKSHKADHRNVIQIDNFADEMPRFLILNQCTEVMQGCVG